MSARKKAKGKASPPKPEAPTCTCFTVTGTLNRDVVTESEPEQASALALLGMACCPWESPQHIVGGTLQQIQHELEVLMALDFDSSDLDPKDVKWMLSSMAGRCRAALEADSRIKRLPVAEQIANAGSPLTGKAGTDG